MSKTRARVIQRPLETLKMAQEGESLTGSNSRPLPREEKETPPPPLLVKQTEKDQFLLLLLLFQRRDPEGKLLRWEEGNGGVCVILLLPGPAAALENERCQNVAKKRSRR